MTPPLIGLTSHPRSAGGSPADQAPAQAAYVQAVAAAGGLPVLVPLGLASSVLRELYDRLDGLLLSGGGDLQPSTYGVTTSAPLIDVDPQRDGLELTLARWALEDGKPVLGICRGQQVLNVAAGGSLIPDLATYRPAALDHRGASRDPQALAHPVRVEPDSYLAKLGTPGSLEVNSSHHQAVDRLADGWRVSASAPDGVIEAIEAPGHPFALAVQWHPERLGGRAEAAALFATFIQITAPD